MAILFVCGWFGVCASGAQSYIWVEGEAPAESDAVRHPWWYDQVKKELFSGGDFLSHFSSDRAGRASYRFNVPESGVRSLWIRLNPVQAAMSFRLKDSDWQEIDVDKNTQSENAAADGKPDLRFIAWVDAGQVDLTAGINTIEFRFHSTNNHHGYLDCFVLADSGFRPLGLAKPDELEALKKQDQLANEGWFAFDPPPDDVPGESVTDLRYLNEDYAGAGGFIKARNGRFIHGDTGAPVRFWAVNGPSPAAGTRVELRREARLLAGMGVNMVRIHGSVFDDQGEPDFSRVRHIIDIVETMKEEGIYSHLSIYFPLWFRPKPDNPWLPGYKGDKHPFAALMFNPAFQEKYRKWWQVLLQTPSPVTGRALIDEPALFGAEIQNEDSFFFWTFSEGNLPGPQLSMLETQFAGWLIDRYGSLANVAERWGESTLPRDDLGNHRVAFRGLYNIFTDRTPRDIDTVRFLYEKQERFYRESSAFLRSLGFKGLITASNWKTANARILGPLENMSYTVGDFVDRHGYFAGHHEGDNAAWSIRNGHLYADRSALRFDASKPGGAKAFVHPVMDVEYNGLPSMISETTWNRPNRFRGEAPLFLACYGALQETDAIVHFAFDGSRWSVKPGFWMQPWTLMSPAMAGQFPAAALIFRKGLIDPGEVMAEVRLNREDLISLRGTPLPQDGSFDLLRLQDVPDGAPAQADTLIDPLIHFVGRTKVEFTDDSSEMSAKDLRPFIDRPQESVASSHQQLELDYRSGLLVINARKVQGASGNPGTRQSIHLRDITISSTMDLLHIVLVSLDNRPISESGRMLLQVMSEEKPTGFQTETAGTGLHRITNIGRDPWRVREFQGYVQFQDQVTFVPLDHNGHTTGESSSGKTISLHPRTTGYLVTRTSL